MTEAALSIQGDYRFCQLIEIGLNVAKFDKPRDNYLSCYSPSPMSLTGENRMLKVYDFYRSFTICWVSLHSTQPSTCG